MFTLRKHPSPPPVFCFGSVLLIFLVFYVSLCSEFRVVMSVMISALKTIFSSSLPSVVWRRLMSYLRYLCVCLCPTHIVLCFCFSLSCVPYVPMLPVSPHCPFLIAPLVFSKVDLLAINNIVHCIALNLNNKIKLTASSSHNLTASFRLIWYIFNLLAFPTEAHILQHSTLSTIWKIDAKIKINMYKLSNLQVSQNMRSIGWFCSWFEIQQQCGKRPLANSPNASGNFGWRVRSTLYTSVWWVKVVRRVGTWKRSPR